MPSFALPLDILSTPSSIRSHLITRSSRKRRRLSPPTDQTVSEDPQPGSSLSTAATNPLSLTPDEVKQYRAAGLELDQELPSKDICDFPHRGLPLSFASISSQLNYGREHGPDDNDKDGDSGDNTSVGTRNSGNRQAQRRSSHLRMHHLAVLTAIMHRCLLEGDIPRASRAWAMILRAQVNGKGVDIQTSAYWGVGAELLMRGGERPARGRRKQDYRNVESDVFRSGMGESGGGPEDSVVTVENEYKVQGQGRAAQQRWGTVAGLEKVKEYYKRLILQHPYKRQFQNSVNALDFWPAMLGCEIYGIQSEQKEALRRLETEENDGDGVALVENFTNEPSSDDDYSYAADNNGSTNDPNAHIAPQMRKEARCQARRRELLWQRRDIIRHTALAAAQAAAARMDELMTSPPFSDSCALLRLRGMLALYTGDLSVPAAPTDDEHRDYRPGDGGRGFCERKISEQRFVARQRMAEHERGLRKRKEEMVRAQGAFEKVRKVAGKLDRELTRLSAALEAELEDGNGGS